MCFSLLICYLSLCESVDLHSMAELTSVAEFKA